MKVPLNTVEEVIRRYISEPDTAKNIIHDIQAELEVDTEEKPPREKKQFVILVSDPNGVIGDNDLVGWVTQIPEADSPVTVTDRIHRATYDFNASKRGRKNPVSTVGEAIEAVSAKFFKEAGVLVKTKVPVQVVVTNNKIPTE